MVKGTYQPKFQKLYDIFSDSLESNYELGAGISIEHNGKNIVNLWGGYTNEKKDQEWTEETIVNVWSVTKAITGICIVKLINDGKLDVNNLVSSYWPEYGNNGKENTTVKDLLTHRAGMFGFQNDYPQTNWNDWHAYVKALEEQKPFRPPGSSQGYHAVTFAWLVGELIKKIDGRTVGEYFKEEFSKPLNLDFHIGLDKKDLHRCAEVSYKRLDNLKPPLDFIKYVPSFLLNKDLINYKETVISKDFLKAFNSKHFDKNGPNSVDWRTAEVPSANGHGTAYSLAKLFGILSNGCEINGNKLIDQKILTEATRIHSKGPDTVLFGSKLNFGYCFMVEQSFSDKLNFAPIFKTETFGHAGIGGSVAFGDLKNKIGYSFVCNRQQKTSNLYKTSNLLTKALYELLD